MDRRHNSILILDKGKKDQSTITLYAACKKMRRPHEIRETNVFKDGRWHFDVVTANIEHLER